MVCIAHWTFGFLSPLFWKFPVYGYLLPTSWNNMFIQTTKGTCKLSPNLMWRFTVFIMIKSNLIKGICIPCTFTFVTFLRRWIWWCNGSFWNNNNGFDDFRAFNILLFNISLSFMLMSILLQSRCRNFAFLMNTNFTSLR